MADNSVTKVNLDYSPTGPRGERYLATGKVMGMRLWDREPSSEESRSRRDYETVGYVIAGRAELHIEEQMVLLEPGDSWVVPQGTEHEYRILERFSAVEATSPPAFVHGRDEA